MVPLEHHSIGGGKLKVAKVDGADELVEFAMGRDVNWTAVSVVKADINFDCFRLSILLHSSSIILR